MVLSSCISCSFFLHATPTTKIYTLSLHDALPISSGGHPKIGVRAQFLRVRKSGSDPDFYALLADEDRAGRMLHRRCARRAARSEEHTSELQSRQYLVCRLLLEKKKNIR